MVETKESVISSRFVNKVEVKEVEKVESISIGEKESIEDSKKKVKKK